MDIEQLRVLISTVADTAGATQANTALRTVATQGEQANTSLRRAGQGAREAGQGFGQASENVLRFAGALTGVELGLSVFTTAGEKIREVVRGSIEAQAESERTVRATAAAYGAAAQQFTAFSESLSQQTGFTRTAILEAALSARTLSQNYGLSIQQTQRLIQVSADLARVRGIGVAESFERIQSAIRGEAEASEFLGLTLNATFLQQNAANGAYRQTFTTLTDAQRAQVVYNEVLRQSGQFSGLAAQAAVGLDGSMSQTTLAANNLSVAFGKLIEPTVIRQMQAATVVLRELQNATTATQTQRQNPLAATAASAAGALPIIGTLISLFQVLDTVSEKLGESERLAAEARQRDLILRQRQAQQLQDEALITTRVARTRLQLLQSLGVDQTRDAERATAAYANQVKELGDALQRTQQIASNLSPAAPQQAAVRALADLQQAEQQRAAARQAEAAIAQQRQQLDTARRAAAEASNEPGSSGVIPAVERQVALLNILQPLEQRRIDLENQRLALQRESVRLAADEAQLQLALLPARQEIARIDRQINSGQAELTRLVRERALLEAQRRATPATQALEDTQAQIERNRLQLAIRGANSPEERAALRREIRDLTRNVLPQQELGAFDARRDLTLAQRQASTADIAEQLRQNELRQQQALIRIGIAPAEERAAALAMQQQQLQLLGTIANAEVARTDQLIQAIKDAAADPRQVNVRLQITDDAGNVVIDQLLEATTQAQSPPVVQLSGVRRN